MQRVDQAQISMKEPGNLRILHADTDDLENPLRGGQPVRTFAINSRLAHRHEITVLTSVYRDCRRRMDRQGVHYRRIGSRIPKFGLSPHLTFLACLGPAIARLPHDLVVEEFTPPVGFCGTPIWTKKPVVLMVQWYFFDQWERRYRLPFARWMRALARRESYRYVIVQSEAMHRELAPLFPQASFRTLPCGLDNDAFIPASSPTSDNSDKPFVLYLGRLDLDHKGLDLLLHAWRDHAAPAQIPLVIAGEGPARPWLENFISTHGLGELVKLVGRVEGEAKHHLLAKCRLLAMPSRYETFGLTALEAMAAGRPVICFDIPHLNEVAQSPWAELLPLPDAAAFGTAVVRLWQDPRRADTMGAAARSRAEHYRWDVIAQQQESFYREIVAQHDAQA